MSSFQCDSRTKGLVTATWKISFPNGATQPSEALFKVGIMYPDRYTGTIRWHKNLPGGLVVNLTVIRVTIHQGRRIRRSDSHMYAHMFRDFIISGRADNRDTPLKTLVRRSAYFRRRNCRRSNSSGVTRYYSSWAQTRSEKTRFLYSHSILVLDGPFYFCHEETTLAPPHGKHVTTFILDLDTYIFPSRNL